MILMKISQNFIKFHLKFLVNLTDFSPHVSVYVMLKKIKFDTFFLLPTFSSTENASQGSMQIVKTSCLGKAEAINGIGPFQ